VNELVDRLAKVEGNPRDLSALYRALMEQEANARFI
jgi:hypothetical protein